MRCILYAFKPHVHVRISHICSLLTRLQVYRMSYKHNLRPRSKSLQIYGLKTLCEKKEQSYVSYEPTCEDEKQQKKYRI